MSEKIIGIDIGGTKMHGVLWNGERVLKTLQMVTPDNLNKFELNLVELLKFFGKSNKIAFGVAGIVEGTKLVESPNISYIQHFDFLNIKGFDFGGKILVDNDTRCFARMEYAAECPEKNRTVFFITLGTGVGRAVGKNGKILNIKKFEYPESWEREYQKLRDFGDNERLAQFIDRKLTELMASYNPQSIVIGGGISRRKGFFTKLQRVLKSPIKKSKFGEDATAIGAAMLF